MKATPAPVSASSTLTPGTAASKAAQHLIRLLQDAHAGELAAIHAYEGHARSLHHPRYIEDQREIRRIQAEEIEHRECVAGMLKQLGATPRPARERLMGGIGHVIWWLCFWSGPLWGSWFIAMYGAGWLESSNVGEYLRAAKWAQDCGHPEFVEDLLRMAEVEREHESFFRGRCESYQLRNPLSRFVPLWPPPLPGEHRKELGA